MPGHLLMGRSLVVQGSQCHSPFCGEGPGGQTASNNRKVSTETTIAKVNVECNSTPADSVGGAADNSTRGSNPLLLDLADFATCTPMLDLEIFDKLNAVTAFALSDF